MRTISNGIDRREHQPQNFRIRFESGLVQVDSSQEHSLSLRTRKQLSVERAGPKSSKYFSSAEPDDVKIAQRFIAGFGQVIESVRRADG